MMYNRYKMHKKYRQYNKYIKYNMYNALFIERTIKMVERNHKTRQQKNMVTNEARKAYYKNWRANNKEKIRAYNQKYWDKKAAESEALIDSKAAAEQ